MTAADFDAARRLRAEVEALEACAEAMRGVEGALRAVALFTDRKDAKDAEQDAKLDRILRLLFDEGGHSVKAVE